MARPPREHLRGIRDSERELPQAPWSESAAYEEGGPAASVGCRLAVIRVAAGAVLVAIAITIYLFVTT